MINDKVKEFLGISLSIAILLGFAYYTGFLKDFSVNNFQILINNFGEVVSGKITSSGIRERSSSSNTTSAEGYKGYRTQKLNADIVNSKANNYLIKKITQSNKKVIFYSYKDKGDSFDKEMKLYLAKSRLNSYFENASISDHSLKRINLGNTSADKICNSFDECNEQRKEAVHRSQISTLFTQCARTMCIFNPKKKEYVNLKTRDFNEAKKMLNAIKSW